jgi:hypothetical protein
MISLSVPGVIKVFQRLLLNMLNMDILLTDEWLP